MVNARAERRHGRIRALVVPAGNIGSQVARAAIAAGYDVVIASSRGPETLESLVAELGPTARAATAAEAGEAGEIVVVTVPLHALEQVPVEPLAGKIVLDTNNYYRERDGRVEALDKGDTTTSQMLQEHLPASKFVKAFSHIMAATSPPTPPPRARRTGVRSLSRATSPRRWSSRRGSTTSSASTRST